MTVMAIPKFERFFREAAGLDVDKADLDRYDDFVNRKLYDMLLVAQAAASMNGRDVMRVWDLPITKGLQQNMHEFERMEEDLELEPILARLAKVPQLDRPPDEETLDRVPAIVGGMSVGLARSFHIIDPRLVNPSSEHWDRAFRLFDLLL